MLSNHTERCSHCREERSTPAMPCPVCGSHAQDVTLNIQGVEAPTIVGKPSLVAQRGNLSDDSFRLDVQTGGGTRSVSHADQGSVTLDVQGTADVGRSGESQAIEVLISALADQGVTTVRRPAEDQRGEDAVLSISSQDFTVQLVTVPGNTEFWREAAVGSASTEVPAQAAAGWVRESILKKVGSIPPDQRPTTLLALDARLAGVVATRAVVSAYLADFPPPRTEFGFAATWLVGPTASTSTQLGGAMWST